MRKAVHTANAPQPQGPYSQAIVQGDFVFVAGQGPINPATGKRELGDARSETKRIFENIRAILEAAGSSLERVVKCNIYCTDAARFDEFNEVFARYFPAGSPARIFLCVGAFPGSFDLEVDCIAVL